MFKPDENSYYGIIPLSSAEYEEDSLTLKFPPDAHAFSRTLTLKDYYQTDTFQIKDRILKAISFSLESFLDNSLPDLYTPVWLPLTLSLILFFISYHSSQSLSSLFYISGFLYLMLLGTTALIFFIQPEQQMLSYVYLLCIYSYSWIFFGISAVFSVIPVQVIRIGCWIVADLASLMFLKTALWSSIKSSMPQQRFLALGIALASHSIIFTVLMIILL